MEIAYNENENQIDAEILPTGTQLLNGQYVIERYLSSGGFGITYCARDSLDRRIVIKECFPEAFCSRKNRTVMARSKSHQKEFRSFVDMFVREAHSLAKLDHPNIVGVHQVFRDNETAYMALDLIDGMDLLEIIEASDERPTYSEVKPILLKLLNAISIVHDQDMLHRDISPDNILINTSDNPILIDFGAAREEASKKSRALSAVLVVKDGYSPQEFYISGSQQMPCSDLYALAATFSHFITGQVPPNSQVRLAAMASKRADPYQPLFGRIDGFPPAFLKALDTAMNVFPQDRIQTARDWIQAIVVQNKVADVSVQRDRNIAILVTQLVQNAQQEAETTLAAAVPNSGPEPMAVSPVSEGMNHEIMTEDKTYKLDMELQKLVADEQDQTNWIEKCQLKTIQRSQFEKSKSKSKPRMVARLVLGAALGLLILNGHAKSITEVATPVVERIIALAKESFGGFA